MHSTTQLQHASSSLLINVLKGPEEMGSIFLSPITNSGPPSVALKSHVHAKVPLKIGNMLMIHTGLIRASVLFYSWGCVVFWGHLPVGTLRWVGGRSWEARGCTDLGEKRFCMKSRQIQRKPGISTNLEKACGFGREDGSSPEVSNFVRMLADQESRQTTVCSLQWHSS